MLSENLISTVPMFSSSFILSKHESFCQFKQCQVFQLSNAYLSPFFVKADGPNRTVPAEKENPHMNDGFKNGYDAPV